MIVTMLLADPRIATAGLSMTQNGDHAHFTFADKQTAVALIEGANLVFMPERSVGQRRLLTLMNAWPETP